VNKALSPVFLLYALTLLVFSFITVDLVLAFDLQPKARLHLDYAHHDDDVKPLDDGWIIRRATIDFDGKFGRNWGFEVGYNLSDGRDIHFSSDAFRDVALTWKGWSVANLTIGQFKLPFGLEELTSSNNISFVERALPIDAFVPSRRIGIGLIRERRNYTMSAMTFSTSIGDKHRGQGFGMRVTLAPVLNQRTAVHLGAAAVTEDPDGKVKFDTAPESRVGDVDLVNTGGIDGAQHINRLGLEGAWRHGPYSVQAEWIVANVRRETGFASTWFDGWYVNGSWVLTGEMRPYKHGKFKEIKPENPFGALELITRYSRIDLDDAGVRGGHEHNFTVGLNYYLNKHVRVMLNYIRAHSERRGVTDDPNIILLRTQFVL